MKWHFASCREHVIACALLAIEQRPRCEKEETIDRKNEQNSPRTFNLPSCLTDDIVEFLLIGGRKAVMFELANGRRKTEKVLLGAERRQWVIADWRLRLLAMKQVRVLLLERSVEIHERRNRR